MYSRRGKRCYVEYLELKRKRRQKDGENCLKRRWKFAIFDSYCNGEVKKSLRLAGYVARMSK
jgi:hypothetical protein